MLKLNYRCFRRYIHLADMRSTSFSFSNKTHHNCLKTDRFCKCVNCSIHIHVKFVAKGSEILGRLRCTYEDTLVTNHINAKMQTAIWHSLPEVVILVLLEGVFYPFFCFSVFFFLAFISQMPRYSNLSLTQSMPFKL